MNFKLMALKAGHFIKCFPLFKAVFFRYSLPYLPNIGSKFNLCFSFLKVSHPRISTTDTEIFPNPKVCFVSTAYLDLWGVPGSWTEHHQHMVQSLNTDIVQEDI